MGKKTRAFSRKHEYIKVYSKKNISKKLSLESVKDLNDDDAKIFCQILKGVGPWTSEMFLMFAYKRLDIFSIGDIALRRAISEIYDK
jgi:DNA-3-methyladenine glycosylase II